MIGRSSLIFIVGVSVAQQAASQPDNINKAHLVRQVSIEKEELLRGAKPSARVYGDTNMHAGDMVQMTSVQLAEVGSPDAEIRMPKGENGAENPVAVPSATPESAKSAAPRATASQIDQLIAIQRSQTTQLPRVGARADVNVCVERSLREVDPGNRAWNPNDSRWNTMRSVIAKDCAAQSDRIKTEVVPAFATAYVDALRRSYEARLSSTEADYLIQFYESDTGQRYLAFRGRLAATGGQGMAQLFSGKMGPDVQAATPDVLKARMQMLRLSPPFAMLIVATQDAGRTGGDASGAPAIGIMMSITAASQGEVLDQIGREYSADSHDFAAFVDSPAETDELRALHAATVAASAAVTKVAMEVTPELNGDLKRWRELYQSLPKDKAASPAQ